MGNVWGNLDHEDVPFFKIFESSYEFQDIFVKVYVHICNDGAHQMHSSYRSTGQNTVAGKTYYQIYIILLSIYIRPIQAINFQVILYLSSLY